MTITRLISATSMAVFIAGIMSACNTMEGAGEDIEELGEEIEQEAEQH